MKRLAVILGSSAFALMVGACDTGTAGPSGDDATQDEITCSSELGITGSFVQSVPTPPSRTGCWPVGTWTFDVSIVSNDCSPAPTPSQQQFKVERDTTAPDPDYAFIYTYLTDPAATHRLSVSGDGGGLCEGGLMVYSEDGFDVWNFKPDLQFDVVTLDGQGTFETHTSDQRPAGGN